MSALRRLRCSVFSKIKRHYLVKQKLALALTLFLLVLSVQSSALGQEKNPAPSTGVVVGKSASQPAIGRRAGRFNSVAVPVIEKDFEEALRLVQENYVEGRRLDYSQVFKSS